LKILHGKRPNTMLKPTERGRAAIQDYRRKLRQALDDLPE
jgi:hypothetical protein